MLHIEWNWLLIMFMFYFAIGVYLGVSTERDSYKRFTDRLEDDLMNAYREIDQLHEVLYDMNHNNQAPIRQARG